MPVFSRMIPVATTAFAVQSIAGLICIPLHEDRFYDFAGSLGFLSTALVSLYYPALKDKFWYGVPGARLPALSSFAPRQLLLTAALGIWSARLGTFLFYRTLKHGGDSRFDEIKKNPKRFSFYWFAQGAWTFLVGLPVYLANTLPAAHHAPLGPRDYIPLAFFASCLILEVLADVEKSAWRVKKDRGEHNEKFITSGLWGISRHPNYVAEIGIWTGIWSLSATALQHPFFPPLTPAIAAVSPLLTWYLITRVSGVPLLEKAAEKKWGDDPQWKAYKRSVPMVWPWGSKN